MSYEKNIKALGDIISKLEDRGTTLDEGISLYEQGIKLTKECMLQLEQSKGRITILQSELGKLMEKEFNIDSLESDDIEEEK